MKRTSDEQVDYLEKLINEYPIDSIEDGMSENDWAGWKKLTDRIGNHCQLVGDDLFVTNVEFLSRGIKEGCGNSILIKVNQIGSLTETLNAIEMLTAMDIRPLLHTVPVRRKTLRSPISLLLPIADRSRRDH